MPRLMADTTDLVELVRIAIAAGILDGLSHRLQVVGLPVLDVVQLPREGMSLERLERELLQQALARFAGNQTRAAHYLGLSRKTLIYRMEKFGLRNERDT
ncbi:hypothetical protein B4Q13_17095 [Lacticaseibacillus rhamnosus]